MFIDLHIQFTLDWVNKLDGVAKKKITENIKKHKEMENTENRSVEKIFVQFRNSTELIEKCSQDLFSFCLVLGFLFSFSLFFFISCLHNKS